MNDERVKQIVKAALPAVAHSDLKRDLWPAMRARIDQQTLRVSAFDWALMAAVLVLVVINPQAALTLFYHL
jgi:hypothetical protein